MFRNLEAEISRKGLTRKDIASIMGCSPGTVSMKLRGKSPIALPEARAIKEFLGVDIPLEDLFLIDEPQKSA